MKSKFKLNIPTGDYDTLGGFILSSNKNIPKKNEILKYNGFTIKILTKNNNRINSVFFRKNVNN